ncbi:hypothetical protein AK812_SmicGene30893 [Symbiodinium microadriaticum]|uniref:Uncharacterized protein n=1 Tax=Symbiodinium microadriaticum TaxID=2951 RepID=A0A1Q9CY53_SYMMI|nr:hypothetical protein AK812_SmicGene30893 [Symbiodinium microadriaticum]
MPGRPNPPPLPACGYVVNATKKGGLPIKVESRAKGKKVTIISGVQGDAQSLVSALGSLLGCGGSVCHAAGQKQVLIQGDQTERIGGSLEQLGCLRGMAKALQKKKSVEVTATRLCAYDKFLRQGDDKQSLAQKLQQEAHAPQTLPGAECFRWHGPWVYCRGCCEQTDLSDVWEERLDGTMAMESLDSMHALDMPVVWTTAAGLDAVLRKLGMVAEVGEAAQTWGLRSSNASEAWKGLTLAEYRRKAVAPGARLLEYPAPSGRAKPSGAPSVRAQRAGEKLRLRPARPMKPPQEQGRFACPTCGHNFSLRLTLKQHMMLSHGEKLVGPVPNLLNVKEPPARPRVPAPPRPLIPPKPPAKKSQSVKGQGPPQAVQDSQRAMELTPSEQSQLEELESHRECPICKNYVVGESLDEHVDKCLSALQAVAGSYAWTECPICFERVHPDLLQSHVERCLTAEEPSDTDSESQNSGAENDAEKQDVWNTCPLCEESFHQDVIAAHVESCIAAYQAAQSCDPKPSDSQEAAEDQERGESEEGSPPMGEDPEAFRAHEEPLLLRGLPVCSVVRGYDPRGEHQMEMVAGEEFALEWEQPFEEGGYWAWGWRLFHGDDGYTPLECGYVPLSHIKTKFGIKQPMLAASPKVSPAVESASPQPLAARCDVEVGLACKGPDALPGKLPTSTDEREIDGLPVCVVVRPCRPRGPHQLELSEGDGFALEWEQPVQEGGYWAWGWPLPAKEGSRRPLSAGYVPRSHLVLKSAKEAAATCAALPAPEAPASEPEVQISQAPAETVQAEPEVKQRRRWGRAQASCDGQEAAMRITPAALCCAQRRQDRVESVLIYHFRSKHFLDVQASLPGELATWPKWDGWQASFSFGQSMVMLVPMLKLVLLLPPMLRRAQLPHSLDVLEASEPFFALAQDSPPGDLWALRVMPSSGNLQTTEFHVRPSSVAIPCKVVLPPLDGLAAVTAVKHGSKSRDHDPLFPWYHFQPEMHALEFRLPAPNEPLKAAKLELFVTTADGSAGFLVVLTSLCIRNMGTGGGRWAEGRNLGHAVGALDAACNVFGWSLEGGPPALHADSVLRFLGPFGLCVLRRRQAMDAAQEGAVMALAEVGHQEEPMSRGLERSALPAEAYADIHDQAVCPAWLPLKGRDGMGPELQVNVLLMLHRVESFLPGLYVLTRARGSEEELFAFVKATPERVQRSESGSPLDLPEGCALWALARPVDVRHATQISACGQEVAGTGSFAAAFFGAFTGWRHPRRYLELLWHAGALGHVFYLAAEAAGFGATGMGCFMDDMALGLLRDPWSMEAKGDSSSQSFSAEESQLQVLYYVTVGKASSDPRLLSFDPYQHLQEGFSYEALQGGMGRIFQTT